MNIRRFHARSVSEALEQVKLELGEEAVILKTEKRRVRQDDGKWRMVWEVAAAIDREATACNNTSGPASTPPAGEEGRRSTADPRLSMGLAGDQCSMGLGEDAWERDWLASPLALFHRVVSALGIPPVLHMELAARLGRELECGDERGLVRRLINLAGSAMKIADIPDRERVLWAFIGPSGAGKTTSMVKIAAQMGMQQGKRGLLVAMDRYKIGGEGQLQGYANLLGLPVVSAKNPQELGKIIAVNSDMDYIFVDTAGRATGDSAHREALNALFKAVPPLKAQLVVEATSKPWDLERWIDRFAFAPLGGVVCTKVDETVDLGTLWIPLFKRGLPLSYLSNGPKIPQHLERPSRERLMRLLFAPLIQRHNGIEQAPAPQVERVVDKARWS